MSGVEKELFLTPDKTPNSPVRRQGRRKSSTVDDIESAAIPNQNRWQQGGPGKQFLPLLDKIFCPCP